MFMNTFVDKHLALNLALILTCVKSGSGKLDACRKRGLGLWLGMWSWRINPGQCERSITLSFHCIWVFFFCKMHFFFFFAPAIYIPVQLLIQKVQCVDLANWMDSVQDNTEDWQWSIATQDTDHSATEKNLHDCETEKMSMEENSLLDFRHPLSFHWQLQKSVFTLT